MTDTRVATLPPGMLAEFHQFRGGADSHQWGIGEAVANAVLELAGQVPQNVIEAAAAKEIECSPALVRKCRETWEVAGEYNNEYDVLTFEHFAVIRFVEEEQARRYLDWCVVSADQYNGKPAPAAVLRRKVRAEQGKPPGPTAAQYIERAWALVVKALDAESDEKRKAKWRQAANLLRDEP